MRILLAVGDTDLRLSLELLLSEEPGIRIAGSVIDTRSLLALVNSIVPDLLLLDLDLPGCPIQDALREIQTLPRQPKIIVLGRQSRSKESSFTSWSRFLPDQRRPTGAFAGRYSCFKCLTNNCYDNMI